MRDLTTRGPPADGGYPLDHDLHWMSDDGGPTVLDPARWSDPDWRDNLGEWDTFADAPAGDSTAAPPAGWDAAAPGGPPAADRVSPPWSPVRVRDGAADATLFTALLPTG